MHPCPLGAQKATKPGRAGPPVPRALPPAMANARLRWSRVSICFAALCFVFEGMEHFIGRSGVSERALAEVWATATGSKAFRSAQILYIFR